MTRTASVRRALAAAVLTPLALTSLVACGGGDEASDHGSSHSSATSSESAGESEDTPKAGETVAAADFVDKFRSGFDNITSAHMTMKMAMGSSGTMTGEGDIDYSTDVPTMAMKLSGDAIGQGGDMELRLVDNVVYMAIPGLTEDGQFVKMDLNDPNSPLGDITGQLDPRKSLDTLEKGLKSVTFVGEEGGLEHYKATVDMQAILDQMKQQVPSSAGMPKTVDYDIYFDDEDRPTKMSVQMGQLGTVETELSDWGKDVSVEAPPSDKVTEMPSAMGSPSA